MAAGAKQNNIKVLGTTDHGPSMPGGPHPYHFGNLKVLPQEINGVRILKGVEANITDIYGTIDLSVDLLAKLDIVMVGLHEGAGYDPGTETENTEAMVNAIANPLVDIVVHPGNPRYRVDIKEIIKAAKRADVILEINNSSYLSRPGSKERCLEIAKLAKSEGVQVILGTDSHYATQIGIFDKALVIAEEAGLTEKDILNSDLDRLEEFVARKREIKKAVSSE